MLGGMPPDFPRSVEIAFPSLDRTRAATDEIMIK